jgi:putative DNA primase/helicase
MDVPPKVARRLLAKAARWSAIPLLTGVVEAPTLRRNGTVLDQPGYDPETGLLSILARSSSRRCRSGR